MVSGCGAGVAVSPVRESPAGEGWPLGTGWPLAVTGDGVGHDGRGPAIVLCLAMAPPCLIIPCVCAVRHDG